MVLRRLWFIALWPQPQPRRSNRRPNGCIRRRSWDPAERPPIRGLCRALGADPGRRTVPLPPKPPRAAVIRSLRPARDYPCYGATYIGVDRGGAASNLSSRSRRDRSRRGPRDRQTSSSRRIIRPPDDLAMRSSRHPPRVTHLLLASSATGAVLGRGDARDRRPGVARSHKTRARAAGRSRTAGRPAISDSRADAPLPWLARHGGLPRRLGGAGIAPGASWPARRA